MTTNYPQNLPFTGTWEEIAKAINLARTVVPAKRHPRWGCYLSLEMDEGEAEANIISALKLAYERGVRDGRAYAGDGHGNPQETGEGW